MFYPTDLLDNIYIILIYIYIYFMTDSTLSKVIRNQCKKLCVPMIFLDYNVCNNPLHSKNVVIFL